MKRMTFPAVFLVALAVSVTAQQPSPAKQGFDKMKALQGEWIDVDGAFGAKGRVVATYKVTGGGTTVVETFPVNTPHEMVTVYHLDRDDIVLTHYCAGGTQPRMRSKGLQGQTISYVFDGGTNIDPAKTSHMHATQMEFVSGDEIRGRWENWSNGKADEHAVTFHLVRKK